MREAIFHSPFYIFNLLPAEWFLCDVKYGEFILIMK